MAVSTESLGSLILNTINTITHFLIGGVTIVCCIFARGVPLVPDNFRQHIILCVIGYVLLMGEAILTFNSKNPWSLTLHHKQKKMVHLVMQVTGSGLVIAGSAIRINGFGGDHFSTIHGITGLVALLLTIISFIGGICNMFLKQRVKLIKICHSFLGTATVVVAIVCLCFALDKPVFRLWGTDETALTMITFCVIILFGVLYSACYTNFKRIFNR